MQIAIEFAPWVVFFLVYKFFGGVYPATAALMVCMALLLAYDWLTTRKVPQMHMLLAGMVWVFGAATLILRDVRFLQWKASVFYWVAGLVLAGSAFVGRMTLLERMLGKTLPEGTVVPAASWRNASLLMGVVYVLLGTLNIWVAMTRSFDAWVTFKVWIAPIVALLISLALIAWLFRDLLFAKDPPP
jgi:intracellular septation protein